MLVCGTGNRLQQCQGTSRIPRLSHTLHLKHPQLVIRLYLHSHIVNTRQRLRIILLLHRLKVPIVVILNTLRLLKLVPDDDILIEGHGLLVGGDGLAEFA